MRHKIDYAFVEMLREQGVDVEIEQIFEQRIMAGKKEWYVLRAISGKEAKVKELLDAQIKNTSLGDYVCAVYEEV